MKQENESASRDGFGLWRNDWSKEGLWESGVTKRMLSCGRWGMLKNEKFNFHGEMNQENCCGCSTGQGKNIGILG